jgi:hypothetical protein
MTHYRPSPGGGIPGGAVRLGVLVLFSLLVFCFCSLLPAVLLASFVFNALILGAGLFATLAQEREKRTIDALRLTQLSSLDILLLKSHGELRRWALGNAAFLALTVGAAWHGSDPMEWALAGGLALAAGGLLSIALALAVSTRSETTSSAVVGGWVCKGVWLVGFPLLDRVFEAVFVADSQLRLFRYLDPAWVALQVSEASFFEIPGMTPGGLLLGALASVVLAVLAVLQSSRMIDSSFETAASLEDRQRHSAYRQNFPLGLHENPFFVRELAWQKRSGAGRWPGYAVFLTLFVAPFLYGLAQGQRNYDSAPVKVVRLDVTGRVDIASPSQPKREAHYDGRRSAGSHSHGSGDRHHDFTLADSAPPMQTVQRRPHGKLCLSALMGLPVSNRPTFQDPTYRVVVTRTGRLEQVPAESMDGLLTQQHTSPRRSSSFSDSSRLEYELGRGLLTGLLLTVIYLFVRGGAFMAGSITGEKERRAWDQIALTGVSPQTFVSGKLYAVLSYPIRQMLLASPALALFVLYKVITPMQLVLVVALLVACFVAAGTLGIACSTVRPTSHQAQGVALVLAAVILLLPLIPLGWLFMGFGVLVLIGHGNLPSGITAVITGYTFVAGVVGGANISPVGAVMLLSGSHVGFNTIIAKLAGPAGALLWCTLSMLAVAALFYQLAVRGLEDGGSVEA